MSRKLCAVFVCILIFGSQIVFAAGAMDDKATGFVKQLWEMYKTKDKGFASNLTDDAMEVVPTGMVLTKAQILDEMNGNTMAEYSLTDWHVQWIDKDVALVHYTATAKGTMKNGQPFPGGPVHCTDTLVNKGGKWLAAFHQETPVMPAK